MMKWHWLCNNPNDLPRVGELVMVLLWNGMTMSSEASVWYELGCRAIKDNKVVLSMEEPYKEVVAWAKFKQPRNCWHFLERSK